MPVVNYIIPPGPRARSVALTAYASGLIMPLWTYPPTAWAFASGVISPVSGLANNPYGFGSAASDPYGGALLAEYSGIGSNVPNIPLGLTAVPLVSGLPSVPIVTSEALAAGAVVNIWADSGVAYVQNANATDATKPAHAFVMAAYTSGATATVILPGQTNLSVSGLTPLATYFLSTTPGQITAVPPASGGNLQQIVGVAFSTSSLSFSPNQGVLL